MRAEIEKIVGNMRGNPDGSLCAQAALRLALLNASAGASRAPALFPVIGSDLSTASFSRQRLVATRDKVMAGETPANPATLVLA
jgi:hypothetical protein